MRFVGIDDTSTGTGRSNLMLVETIGQPVTVRLSLHYTFAGGSLVTAFATGTKDVTVNGNDFLVLTDVVRSIIGSARDNYGDLRNMQLEVETLGGGRVMPFLQTIDSASGDVTIRSR